MECAAHSSLDIQISKGPTEVRIGWAVRVRQLDAASQICMQRRAHAACGVSLPGCLGSIARRASGSVCGTTDCFSIETVPSGYRRRTGGSDDGVRARLCWVNAMRRGGESSVAGCLPMV